MAENPNNIETVKAYLELSNQAQAAFFNRRSYEWKVSFGFWAALIAAISKGTTIPIWLAGFVALIVVGLHAAFIRGVAHSHRDDKDIKHFFQEAAHAYLQRLDPELKAFPKSTTETKSETEPKPQPERKAWYREWGAYFQLGVTLVLAILAVCRPGGNTPAAAVNSVRITNTTSTPADHPTTLPATNP